MSRNKRRHYQHVRVQQGAWEAVCLRQTYVLRFVDRLATTTLAFALPLMIYNITHNVALSGASFTIEWLPRILAIPVAGPLVDRMGPRRFYLIADTLRAGIMLGAALYLWRDPKAWIVLVGVAVLAGMLAQSTFVAAERLGMEVVGSRPLHRVQATQVGIDQMVQVLGPVVGGVLLAVNASAVFLGLLLLLAASVYYAMRLRLALNQYGQPLQRVTLLGGFGAGLHIIAHHRALVHVVVGTALYNLLLALLLTVTPAVVEQRLHHSAASISVLWSLAAGASVIAVGAASRVAQRFGITPIGVVSGAIGCAACLVAALTRQYWAYVVCLMVFMAMDASYAVFIRTARARIIPKSLYGTAVGMIVLLSLLPYPLAGVLVAMVPFHLIPQLLIVCTAFTALVSIWSFAVMDHRTLNTTLSVE